jgi:xanthine dehydrogenase iron-sulfur cluster and FAD-binding subunit A
MKSNIGDNIQKLVALDDESYNVIVNSTKKKVELYHENFFVRYIKKYSEDMKTIRNVKEVLRKNKFTKSQQKPILDLVKSDISLNRRIESLVIMQNLFKYWHVAHLPFALVMLIIMIIHIAVTIVFGYRWIF